jgi:hypothetical protein
MSSPLTKGRTLPLVGHFASLLGRPLFEHQPVIATCLGHLYAHDKKGGMDTDQGLALGIACIGFVSVTLCLIYAANRIWCRRYRPVSLSDEDIV